MHPSHVWHRLVLFDRIVESVHDLCKICRLRPLSGRKTASVWLGIGTKSVDCIPLFFRFQQCHRCTLP